MAPATEVDLELERGSSSAPELRPPGSLSARLWEASADVYAAIRGSRFITGLQAGTLSEAAFLTYLAQDERYIRSYRRSLARLASRAPSEAAFRMLVRHASGTIGAESVLGQQIRQMLGAGDLNIDEVVLTPTTAAYTSGITACCERGTFLEGLVSVMPCYWIYARIGSELEATGSPNPAFARWIASYGEVDFDHVATEALDLLDEVARGASEDQWTSCISLYRQFSQYEWLFWESAYDDERWPFGAYRGTDPKQSLAN